MQNDTLNAAITKLGAYFNTIEWKYLEVPPTSPREKTQLWPGDPDEAVMICVYKGRKFLEQFHRQDFFFFNFAYKGNYEAFSYRDDNTITIYENECYIGQPYAGYAIHDQSEDETIIVGVLIQAEAFFKTFFHVLSSDRNLFQFFLSAQQDEFSEEYIHLHFEDAFTIRRLLEMMIVEYATPHENTQEVLKPLTLALLMQVARQYSKSNPSKKASTLSEQIVQYMGTHIDTVTLNGIAQHYNYHPNYISTLLPKELGKTFSEILLELRMERAVDLLKGTPLPISEIALLLGYGNNSNFYKAFRAYYGVSPREYIKCR